MDYIEQFWYQLQVNGFTEDDDATQMLEKEHSREQKIGEVRELERLYSEPNTCFALPDGRIETVLYALGEVDN